jgi:hypothetical protein
LEKITEQVLDHSIGGVFFQIIGLAYKDIPFRTFESEVQPLGQRSDIGQILSAPL